MADGDVEEETPAVEPVKPKDAPAEATEEKPAATEVTAGPDPMSMPPHGTEVFVSKIPREATDAQVRSFCETAGEVFDIRLTKDPGNPGQNKGYAFMLFKEKDGATAALSQLNQTELPDFPGKKVTIVKSEVKNKLFIGNMPREMTKEAILGIFSAECKGDSLMIESVSPQIPVPHRGIEGMDLMLDKESPGHNRGFGFLEFYNHTAAEAARRKLGRADYRLGDRQITVKSIYIGNLPDNAVEGDLKNIFSAYGKITGLSLLKDPQDQNKLRNYCFLHYEDRLSALKAIEECEISKQELNGKELQVHMARPQTQRDQEAATGGYSEGYGNQASYGGGRGGGYSSREGRGGGGGGGGYGTGSYAVQAGRGGYGASGGRGAARPSYGASAGYGARGGGRAGYGGGHGQAAYAGGIVDDGYDGYGYDYGEGYEEDYEEEDYSSYGYGGYAQAAGMGGMIPMIMPGGQIAYVMPSAAGMVGGMGGSMGMMVDPSQMAAAGAPPRRAAPGRAAGGAAASEHHGGQYAERGGRGGGGYGAASAPGRQAGYGASAGAGSAYGESRRAPAAPSGGGGYVAGRGGRGAAYGQSIAAGRGAASYGSARGVVDSAVEKACDEEKSNQRQARCKDERERFSTKPPIAFACFSG
eukprot:gene494-1900_t